MLTNRIEKLRPVLFVGAVLISCGCSATPPTPQPSASVSTPAVPGSPYENMLIRRPGTSAEDTKVYIVQNGRRHWVVNASWFTAHGYKFPDDVHEITVAQFEAVPAGDPIP